MSALSSSLVFLVQTLGNLYTMAVLLRFLFQVVQADFYNPISQAIVTLTTPLLRPLRACVPRVGQCDTAALVLALIVQILLLYGLLALRGFSPLAISWVTVLVSSGLKLAELTLDLYLFSFIIIAIASWVAPGSYHPGLLLLQQLTNPLSSRVRRVIPPLGGLDFSLMVMVLVIITLKNLLAGLLVGL